MVLIPKFGTMKVFWTIWTDRSDLSLLNRSDRSRQVCQIANWTTPLCRSRRDNQNAYIERPIRSPDEGVILPEDLHPGLTGQTGPKRPI